MKIGNSKLKAQASIEQLVSVSLTIGALSFLLVLVYTFTMDSIQTAEGRNSVEKIANAADYVGSLGPGAKTVVSVTLPASARFLNASGRHVYMRLTGTSGESDLFANTHVGMNPYFSSTPGLKILNISALPNGSVLVVDG